MILIRFVSLQHTRRQDPENYINYCTKSKCDLFIKLKLVIVFTLILADECHFSAFPEEMPIINNSLCLYAFLRFLCFSYFLPLYLQCILTKYIARTTLVTTGHTKQWLTALNLNAFQENCSTNKKNYSSITMYHLKWYLIALCNPIVFRSWSLSK